MLLTYFQKICFVLPSMSDIHPNQNLYITRLESRIYSMNKHAKTLTSSSTLIYRSRTIRLTKLFILYSFIKIKHLKTSVQCRQFTNYDSRQLQKGISFIYDSLTFPPDNSPSGQFLKHFPLNAKRLVTLPETLTHPKADGYHKS